MTSNAKDIDLLVLDVDGVLTDGRVTLTASGEEINSFHVRDGSGIKYWMRAGKQAAIISGRSSPAVICRAGELGIEHVRLGAKDKLPVLEALLAELGVDARRTAVVGDDLPDLPMIRCAGWSAAVADAVSEVRDAADYVTTAPGGTGAVREVIELLLRSGGLWETILQRYRPAGEGKSS